MKKKIVLILSIFHLLFQENTIIKSFFDNYINLKSAEFTFRILTTQNNEVKFESNGEFLIKNDKLYAFGFLKRTSNNQKSFKEKL